MRIFLTGATGFIGGHILRALATRGHSVTCLARGPKAWRLEDMALPGVTVVQGEFTRPAEWTANIPGHDAIINAVGIIRETAGVTFQAVHAEAPIALFEGAAKAGVRKIVQISALGTDDQATTRYHVTKLAADRKLDELGVPYVILRPSIVYGEGDESMSFFLSLAAMPITPVPGDGKSRLHPILVDDLVRAVTAAVEDPAIANVAVDVGGGGAPVSFDELLDALARRLGKRRATKLHAPWRVMEWTAAVTDALGGRGPITGDELSMLRRENFADNTTFRRIFGFDPLPLEAGLARRVKPPADVRAARLAAVKVPLRLSVAFIWLATGLLSMLVPASREMGFAYLAQVGITGGLAATALYGTCLLEVALGLATAVGWRIGLCGAIQLALVLGFTAILTVGLPELWLHPFGPLTKNIPILGATLAMMAMEDGRS